MMDDRNIDILSQQDTDQTVNSSSNTKAGMDNVITDSNEDSAGAGASKSPLGPVKKILSWVVTAAVAILLFLSASYLLDSHHNLLMHQQARRMYSAAQEALEDEIYEQLGDVEIKFAPYSKAEILNNLVDVTYDGTIYTTMIFTSYLEVDDERLDYQILIGFTDRDFKESNQWYARRLVGFADLLGIRLNSNVSEFYYEYQFL